MFVASIVFYRLLVNELLNTIYHAHQLPAFVILFYCFFACDLHGGRTASQITPLSLDDLISYAIIRKVFGSLLS